MKTQMITISLMVLSVVTGSGSYAQKKNASLAHFEQTNEKFLEWFNTGQIDSLSSLYLETTCMIPDNLPALNNRENVREYYRFLFDSGFRFSDIKPTGHVTSDNMIIERGTWKAIIHDNVQLSGTYLSQWRYSNKKWFIENEMTNVVTD
jgi:hypothetical protein